jgi:hypothetical protein
MTIYRAAPVTQRDGSELQNSNCLMGAAATGLDFHTLGGKRSTAGQMRDYSGDTSGGTNTDEITRAWDRGYSETARDRDGDPWDQVLDALWGGRLVMLQVWHATVGGPCLSGSGAYGHGLAVAPEQRLDDGGSRQWLVSDPWCKPPKWSWVDQSRLKAGAERWVSTVLQEVGGAVRDLRDVDPAVLRAIVRRLMRRWDPAHPAAEDPPGVGGTVGILFATTDPHPDQESTEADDVTIAAAPGIRTGRMIHIHDGADYYADAGTTKRLGEFAERDVVFIGNPQGEDPGARAVLWRTAAPYDDGEARDSIVYVRAQYAGEPYAVIVGESDV